ncbi:MAG: J domain-containing protein [Thermodesulfobacteriota bacterium]
MSVSKTKFSSLDFPLLKREGVYLARDIITPEPVYYIRQSYRESTTDFSFYREILNIGKNPADYLICIGDRGYYISPVLEEAVEPFVEGDPAEILEDLFWPFVPREIRLNLEKFGKRGMNVKPSALTDREQAAIEQEIHIFDRRRLHYFCYGSIDQSRLFQMPLKLCRRLLGMSRDQKEQYFINQERILTYDEVKQYIYTVFNLQRYFSETVARVMPQGLDQEKMDDCFVKELCDLKIDDSFWRGIEKTENLSPYLVHYLIRFFDYDFGRSSALDDYIRQFINSHRQFYFPEKKTGMNMSEASDIFSESQEKIKELSKSELTRLFRRKAKKLHPDTGGKHEDFLKLVEAYEKILRTK